MMVKPKILEILLIEDNEDDAEQIEKSLDPERYHIINVWNGKKALDFLIKKDNDIDVVLLDKSLPYKNGLEILKEIKKNGNEYAFIFLTIDNNVETAVEAMKLGALDFLPKNSGFESLSEMIEKVHEIHQNKLERKQTEKALWESEKKFRLIAENSIDCIWTLDTKLRFTYLSPSLERLMGFKPEQWIGTKLSSHFKKREFLKVGALAAKAIIHYKTFDHVTFETKILNSKNEEVYVEISSKTLLNNQGKLIGLQGITRDISERKQAEESILESHGKLNRLNTILRLMCDNLPEFIWAKDLQRRFMFVNKSCCEDLLNARDVYEPIGETDIFFAKREKQSHPENPNYHTFGETCAESDKVVLETKKVIRMDESGYIKGKLVTLNIIKSPFWDKNGKLIGTVGCCRDVTREREIEDERKQAVKALQESKEKLRTILDIIPDIVLQLDTNLKILWANKTTLNMKPDAIGQLCYKALTCRNALCPNCPIVKVLKTGQIERGIVHLQSLAGIGESYWDTVGIPIKDAQGKMISIVKLARNITEKMQAEEEIRKLSKVVETTPEAVVITDMQGMIEYVNHGLLTLGGFEDDNLIIGKLIFMFSDEEGVKQLKEKIIPIIISEGSWRGEVPVKRKDSSIFKAEMICSLLLDEKGKPKYLLSQFHDITKRKKAEEKLAMNFQQQKLLTEVSYMFTKLGNFDEYMNKSIRLIGKYSRVSRVYIFENFDNGKFTKNTYEWCNENIEPQIDNLQEVPYKIIPSYNKFLSGKEMVISSNILELPQDLIDILKPQNIKSILILPIYVKNQFFGFMGFDDCEKHRIWDKSEIELLKTVTNIISTLFERKQAEEEKTILETQLRRTQKLETIGTLAGGIAHDFNNILTPIYGYTDMALSSLSPSNPLYNDLKQVLTGVHRAKDLVRQILTFSRKMEQKNKPLALHLIIKEAIQLLRPSIPSTIEIRQKIDTTCEKVLADPSQMHQVIVNLCTNSFHAMEQKGGVLTIELKQVKIDSVTAQFHPDLEQEEYARLTVTDTGVGMDESILERIFEPFYTTKAIDKGTGLGLSVVHGIVLSYHGDIIIHSEPGKGSTFHVYLPISKATVSDIDTKKAEKIQGGQEHILLVDDEESIATMLKKMLELLGYKVDARNSSTEVLKTFRQQPESYDLLITDLTMPKMTGLELAKELHNVHSELPIIIMTGYGENITTEILEHYNINKIIGKPIELRELATAIRKVLDK